MYIANYEKNIFGRDFCVGDIHGAYDKLMKELVDINFDTAKDRLFTTGDIVDRGPKSLQCLRLLNENWFFSVKGNHEFFFEDNQDGFLKKDQYIAMGGQWALDLSDEETQEVKELIKNLPYGIEVETDNGLIGIVHAEVPGDDWNYFKSLDFSSMSPLMFNSVLGKFAYERSRMKNGISDPIPGVYQVVVGHTVTNTVNVAGNTISIDTGANYKDRTFTLYQIQGQRTFF